MANEIRNNHVWFVDTAGVGFVTTENVYIKHIRWLGRAGTAEITNEDDKVVWEAAAADGAESSLHGSPLHLPSGFKVPTLGGGRLYIYLAVGSIRG